MEQIESESKFIWRFIWHILITPWTLIEVLFRKKRIDNILKPFNELFHFIFEPKFTITIIILNFLVHIIGTLFLNENIYVTLMNFPADLFTWQRLYSFVSYGFLHAGWAHLIGNSVGIFIFGRVVERKLSVGKMFLIYFGGMVFSGVFNSIISLFVLSENIPMVGASGALMALVAAAILVDPFYLTYELILPLPVMIAGWITIYADVVGVLSGVNDNIAHFAHIGGYISVTLTLYFLERGEREHFKKGLIINLVSIGLFLVLIFLMRQGVLPCLLFC